MIKDIKRIILIILSIVLLLSCSFAIIFLFNYKPSKNTGKILEIEQLNEKTGLPEEEILQIRNNFDLAFLKLNSANNNIVYSPYAIKKGLYMVIEGLDKGLIASKEINQTIKDEPLEYGNATSSLNIYSNLVTTKVDYNDEYIKNIFNKYNVTPIKKNNISEINDFIKIESNSKPSNFYSEEENLDNINLVTTLGLNLNWSKEFYTDSMEFIDVNYNMTKVDSIIGIYTSNETKYYADPTITVLSLPFQNANNMNLEYVAIMPNSIEEYIANMDIETLNKEYNKLNDIDPDTELKVTIPKYNSEYYIDLNKTLDSIGISKIFNKRVAKLSNIYNDKTYIDSGRFVINFTLNSKGVSTIDETISEKPSEYEITNKTIILNINHPFIYLIINKDTKDILLVGNVLSF